jgi:protein O-GlcNAc transferase
MAKLPIASREMSSVEQTLGHAVQFHQRGRLDKAERLYQQILKRRPDHFDALHLLGVIRGQHGRNEEAARLIGRAIAARPGSAEAHSNLGNVLQALDRCDEAVASYDQALAINPRNPDALNNRGNALQRLERYTEALACYDAAVAIRPNFADAFYNRGNALAKLTRHPEAVQNYDRAIRLRPDYAEAFYNRGKTLHELRRFEDALASYDKAITIKPAYGDALGNRGAVLVELNRCEEALASYDRALAIEPANPGTLHSRAGVLQQLQRYEQAVLGYRKVLESNPAHPYAASELLKLQIAICNWPEVSRLTTELSEAFANGRAHVHPLLMFYFPTSASDQRKCAEAFVRRQVPVVPEALRTGGTRAGRRIRIAYLSADFRNHVVATVIAELFERHDRNRFEVFGISFGPDDRSDLRRRIVNSFDQFHDVRFKSDEEAARLLHSLEIDIAVDLMGHTEFARPGILAWRPARIQAVYLGYPGTTGADFIDYLLADEIVVPSEHQESYSENIIYLPDSYLINDSRRMRLPPRIPSRRELGLPETGFVFCGFGPSYKITRSIFDVWMRLLARIEGSVLWLARPNELAKANLRGEAEARGVDPRRLVFAPKVAAIEDHLARQRRADLFLDSLPYNAHTTAANALWVGLPVLTCKGSTFAGWVGASLLQAAGLPELVAQTLEEYEARAIDLATDPPLLHSLRAKLEQNRLTCPLFDSARFRRHIEAAYLEMWERHSRGERPRGFRVDRIEPMQRTG